MTWDSNRAEHQGGAFDEHAPLVEELLERIRRDGPMSSTDVEPRAAIDWYWRPTNQVRAILEALAEAGHPRARPARRQPARLRPRRAALPGRPARPARARARAAPPQAPVALPGPRPARADRVRASCGSAPPRDQAGRPERRRPDARRAPGGAARGRRARPGRRRRCPRRALRRAGRAADPRRLEQAERGGSPTPAQPRPGWRSAARASRSSPRSIRSSGTATSCGRLYGFDYVWEVYVPAAKRRWGYYVLPILFGDRLVGRIEPRIDRKAGVLRVLGLWWETGFDPLASPGFVEAFAAALEAHREFGGVARIALARTPNHRPFVAAVREGLGQEVRTMTAVRHAEAAWEGDLISGRGTVSAMSSGAFRDLPVSWAARTEAPRGQDEPRGAPRGRPRVVLRDGPLGGAWPGAGRRRSSWRSARTSRSTRLEAGWRVVSSALTVRGTVPGRSTRRASGRRPRRPGRLPDLAGAQGQRRPVGRGDPGGLTGATGRRRPTRVRGPISRPRPGPGSGPGCRRSASGSSPRRHPASRRRGRNRSLEVDVAVAAVGLELGVVADVLAEQDPVGVTAGERARRAGRSCAASPWRSMAVKLIPRKSNSRFAPRRTISR